MKTWNLKFASYKKTDDILETIISGAKKIETRPYTPFEDKNYANIEIGDKLVFKSTDTGKEIEKYAKGCKIYHSVKEMLENESFEDILPGVGSREALESVYEELKEKWGKDYKHALETYGVVAIYI